MQGNTSTKVWLKESAIFLFYTIPAFYCWTQALSNLPHGNPVLHMVVIIAFFVYFIASLLILGGLVLKPEKQIIKRALNYQPLWWERVLSGVVWLLGIWSAAWIMEEFPKDPLWRFIPVVVYAWIAFLLPVTCHNYLFRFLRKPDSS